MFQMGFLLGEALEFVIRSYTDSDNQVETIKIHISEFTCLFDPVSGVSLYDGRKQRTIALAFYLVSFPFFFFTPCIRFLAFDPLKHYAEEKIFIRT